MYLHQYFLNASLPRRLCAFARLGRSISFHRTIHASIGFRLNIGNLTFRSFSAIDSELITTSWSKFSKVTAIMAVVDYEADRCIVNCCCTWEIACVDIQLRWSLLYSPDHLSCCILHCRFHPLHIPILLPPVLAVLILLQWHAGMGYGIGDV